MVVVSMIKLNPCWRCGSTNIDYGYYTGTMRGWDYVQCEKCGAEVSMPRLPDGSNEAIKAWNKKKKKKILRR
jgi:hypothetical protein